MNPIELTGRSSSHFTRLPRIFAHELDIDYTFVPIFDMSSLNPEDYAGNPALRLPILKLEHGPVFGAVNICRALAAEAGAYADVIWPEQDVADAVAMNANELVIQAMATQVTFVVATKMENLDDSVGLVRKSRASLCRMLEWLDSNVDAVVDSLPQRRLSVFEAALFCLVEHLTFRESLSPEPYRHLVAFAAEFGGRESAHATVYRFDVPEQPRV